MHERFCEAAKTNARILAKRVYFWIVFFKYNPSTKNSIKFYAIVRKAPELLRDQ